MAEIASYAERLQLRADTVRQLRSSLDRHIETIGAGVPFEARGDDLRGLWELFDVPGKNPQLQRLDQSMVVQVPTDVLAGARGVKDFRRRLIRVARGVKNQKYAVLEI